MWNVDQAVYLVTAKSLSAGSGNRLICFPDEPPSTKYPIGYPLVISSVIKAFGLNAIGLTAIRFVSVCAALCHYLLNIRLFRCYFSRRLSLLAALAIAVSPLTFEFAGELMAEELFGAVWALALVLTIEAVGSRANDRRAFLLAATLGVTVGSALLLRTIGIAIIAGMLPGLAVNRRWKLCLISGLAAGMTIAPWILWSSLNGGGTFKSYSAENAIAIKTPLTKAVTIATDVVPAILFPPLQTNAFDKYVPLMMQSGLCSVIGGCATIIGLIGACSLLRRRDILVPAAVPYLLIILLWWWEPSRFLLPLYPILAIMLLSGLRVVTDACNFGCTRRVALAGYVVCVASTIGGLAVDATRLKAVWKYEHWHGAREASYWKATKEALDWISSNTPPGTQCVSPQPESVYLFTNRRSRNLPLTVDAMERMFAQLPGDSIVLATKRPNYGSPTREEYAYSGIRSVVRRSPGLLTQVWQSPDQEVEIYKVFKGSDIGEVAGNTEKGFGVLSTPMPSGPRNGPSARLSYQDQ
jgi:hypothetical protein